MARACQVVARSLARYGRRPEHLLQHLIALQQSFSFVPAAGIDALTAALDVTRAQCDAAIDFYAFLHRSPRGQYEILLSDNITDRMLGNQRLMQLLCDRLGVDLGVPRADGRVSVDFTSCTGMGDQAPALLVNGFAVTRLDEDRIRQIAALVETRVPLQHWPQAFFAVSNNVHRPGLLLRDLECRDAGLAALFARGPDAVLSELERSGLRGRGGAGFTTALKWRFCRETGDPQKVVVCNADEGEPGTFKDRVLLTAYADLVIEGMTLCAAIVGAREGFLYLRGEYRYLVEHLEAVLQRRRELGLLGAGIGAGIGAGSGAGSGAGRGLGTDGARPFDFDIQIHLGAGAYICGEESALIESLEGKRGVTRKRPPYPVTAGYLERPTVVNNVETFLAAARIAEHGGYWFRSEGTDQSAGTKILSVSGDCARPGVYEFPFGTAVRDVLAACGAEAVQAVQVSGAAGTTLKADEFDRLLAFEDLPTAGSFMVFGEGRDLLEMVRNFAAFFAHESCGFCTPCRVGGVLLRELVEKVATGQASAHELDELRHIGAVMRRASHCGLGHTAPNPVLQTLDKFPHIYRQRLKSADYTPAFDLDAALAEARRLTGRDDRAAHLSADEAEALG
ncbi:NADP oxidoreductase [Halochromatium glycolicum]|uniref:NADH-quinone oxidoreductase subunit F n=2 Tax=Halochromatium glycolicum TaxID=85075 RepID=A0AAJ0U1F0_9GAMM|nr:NADP oxidoreductase [Halochromatium glycolicum]